MPEPDDDSHLDWDDVVDVICVGTSPGVLAYAICCAVNELDVLLVRPPGDPDPCSADWYAAMTADLAHADEGHPGFSLARVAPIPEPAGKRRTLEPFVGEQLRLWSAQCLRSPFGVMFTQVPELLVPMRADDESVTAAFIGELDGEDLVAWLEEGARRQGFGEPEDRMAAMVLEDGRIAGVELDDGSLIAARTGLALPVGTESPQPDPTNQAGCTVAVVGRPAGRFATVDLLRR